MTVIEDGEDPAWPLKALYYDHVPPDSAEQYGIRAARSKDGIDWRPMGLVLPGWGDRFNAVPPRIDGKFIYLGRAPTAQGASRGPGGFNKKRLVFYAESSDLRAWSLPELVLQPDPEDPPPLQFYSALGFPYGDHVVGAIERMHMTPDVLDTEIIWSRDGRDWRRSRSRPRFIEWGSKGAFDSSWLNLSTSVPITMGNSLWFYYSGRSAAHAVGSPHQSGAIGLATLRLDGFCSLYGGEAGNFSPVGKVLTRPVTWVDGELLVNVDPRADLSSHPRNSCGQLRVEVRGDDNKPIDGFALEQCVPLSSNTFEMPNASAVVHWHDEKSMRQLVGKRVRLVFELDRAHLYSFRAGESS